MRYHAMGQLPPKRHVQFRDPAASNGHAPLLSEEVMGYEGFSGNESILYHLHSPCRLSEVGDFEPIVRDEWVPDAHVHRLADTRPIEPGGDPVTGRRLLMWNGDIEVSVCKPTETTDGFYRNGEGDEVVYVHRGTGVVRTMFGPLAYREKETPYVAATEHGGVNAWWSLGLRVGDGGKVTDVLVGSPADKAGFGPDMQIVAVNGRAYSDELLKRAIDDAKEGSTQQNKGPIEFIVSNTSYYKVLKIDYHGGQRYPYLERVKGEKDVLEEILKPLAPVKK